ncbi:pilus assembly protein TadG-related protein [Radiobacillus sp. PE A8.2]|uniref:pilus assembly protein TadG-related protein n=1 Tax=Radiobacillus sp. PE A8.2 TaxID=3380349 RepID=UPI00388DD30C
MKKIWRIFKKEDGNTLVFFSLVMVVLMGFAALAIDVGMVQFTKTKLQNAADAAALAGVQDLPNQTNAKNTATHYAQVNGAENAQINPENNNPNKIEVIATKNVEYSFARVLGFTDANVSARAVAAKVGPGGPFDYALFSGHPDTGLFSSASMIKIHGSVHSNSKLEIYPSVLDVTGSVEAVKTLTTGGSQVKVTDTVQGSKINIYAGSVDIGKREESAAAWVDMPDFSEQIKTEAEAAGTVYQGNQRFTGPNFNIDAPIYVNGNLDVNASNFTGNGIIVASGDITFSTSKVTNTGSSVAFYSANGNINIYAGDVEVEGILYAPNGTINISTSNLNVKGRVIGQRLNISAGNINITSSAEDLSSLPSESKLVE